MRLNRRTMSAAGLQNKLRQIDVFGQCTHMFGDSVTLNHRDILEIPVQGHLAPTLSRPTHLSGHCLDFQLDQTAVEQFVPHHSI